MRRRAAVAAGVLALGIVGAGCGAEAPRDTGGGASTSASAAPAVGAAAQSVYTTAPARGEIDSFTWNLPNGEPASLDWARAYDSSPNQVLANMCEGLMRQEPDFSIVPGLAESFEQADDRTLVYKLRSGVKFWDGREMTADDVVFSLSRHMDPDQGSFWSTPFYSNVKSISKTGDLEVTVKLKRADAVFNRMMATPAGVIGQQAFVESRGRKYGTPNGGIMCTGPFQLDSWKPGTSISLSRNDGYWDADGKAKAGALTFRFITDESTMIGGLQSGELDGTFQVPPAGVSQLRSAPGTLTFGASTEWFAFRPTEKDGAAKDPRVMQALSLVLDRESIARVIFGGAAVPAGTPIQPGAFGYARETFAAAAEQLPAPAVDAEKAKALVAEAGAAAKRPIVIAVMADVRTYGQAAQTLQDAARGIGLDVKVEAISTAQFTNLYFDKSARAPYDLFTVQQYGAGVAEPLISLSEFTPLSAYNYGELDDPVVNRGVEQGMATYDDEKRAELASEAEKALVAAPGLIPVVNLLTSVYQGPKITGSVASLSYLYYPWAADVGAA